MKKFIALFAITGMLFIGLSNSVFAQDNVADDTTKTDVVDTTKAITPAADLDATDPLDDEEATEDKTFHQVLKEKFIEGGAGFMGIVLVALILGLALCIERIIYLSMASTNTKNLLTKVESALESGGIEAAQDVCKNTRGPVASIFFQGLAKFDAEARESLEVVEKSVVSYGSVMMGRLEKGVSWISLFIAIAPMLGFMGTVIGMIGAFDAIQAAGDINPTIVAGGIKVALLTTVFGLITAIFLQLFYNYIVAKIDSIVNDMEDSTISFIDLLAKHQK
jgi:biopolymer transport protein ExbB